ncbi:MAG: endonuclease [Bacteroidales bacterium]|nr:endonuclease [Bacteroidales bacterium]
MKFRLSLFAIAILSISALSAQETFRVMFYNCENFFDIRHDSLKNDEDFLPNSTHFWTFGRYKEKQRNLAKVITAVGGWETPALVGLCEVENDSVIYALTRFSPLKELNYRYVMTNSPDRRGIDVVLLYQRDQFKLISSVSHRIYLERPTRDILHVTGKVSNGDTLDVFVCHFPSRLGGENETNELRATVAKELRKQADSIRSVRANSSIVIMGDFNDYPTNESLISVLGAKLPTDSTASYVNLMLPLVSKRNIGSHKFESEWGILDQLIVSRNLLNSSRIKTKTVVGNIFNADFLLEEDLRFGGKRPHRTYEGFKYVGGFSDHLPVWVDLEINP